MKCWRSMYGKRAGQISRLFSRTGYVLESGSELTLIHIDDSVSSLSAILLNDAYYRSLLQGRDVIDDFSVLRPTWLIPFKAKAWLDSCWYRKDSDDYI